MKTETVRLTDYGRDLDRLTERLVPRMMRAPEYLPADRVLLIQYSAKKHNFRVAWGGQVDDCVRGDHSGRLVRQADWHTLRTIDVQGQVTNPEGYHCMDCGWQLYETATAEEARIRERRIVSH